MERSTKPGIFRANEAALEKEAQRQQQQSTTSPTTTVATTTNGTTQSTTTAKIAEGPTTTTTTVAPTQTTTTQAVGTTTTTTTAAQKQEQTARQRAEDALPFLRESLGNPDLTIEDVLAKFQQQAPLTDDQKRMAEEQRLLQISQQFIGTGKGTLDDFHRIRNLKNIPDDVLVKESFAKMLKEDNPAITDKEIDDVFNNHYFIGDKGGFTDAEMKVGKKRLAEDAARMREVQSRPLTEVESELKLDEDSITEARKWQSTAEQFSQQMPSKVDVSLGKVGDTELADFAYVLTDDEKREISQALKDPAHLVKSIVDTKTGKTDPSKLFNILLWQKIGPKAVRAAATTHYSMGIDAVEATLDNRPDLTRTGDRSTSADQATALEEGKKQIVKDANNVLGGRRPRAKSL